MSDTTYNVFQHYGTAAQRAAFVPSPPAATQPIYVWYETDTNNVYIYTTAWHGPFAVSGGAPTLHAPTHSDGGTDEVDVTDLGGYPGGATTFLRDDGTFAAPTIGVHATSHSSGGSDPVTVTNLAGYPGTTTTFLRGDNTFSTLPAKIGAIGLIIDGGTSVITTGVKGYIEIPFACTIQAVTLLADLSGSIVIDIWKDTYAAYPPIVGDTITASAKPTITTALKSQDTTLTGWTTSVTAGDILGFNVDSVSTIKKVTLSLKIQVT